MLTYEPRERVSAQEASEHIYLAARTNLTFLSQPNQMIGESHSSGANYADESFGAVGAVDDGMEYDEAGAADGVGKRRSRDNAIVRLRYRRVYVDRAKFRKSYLSFDYEPPTSPQIEFCANSGCYRRRQ
jgi:hypothetical protein